MNLIKKEFIAWPKIPRLINENITITEKMNGTNACIIIEGGEVVGIQSRKRFIYPEGTEGQPKGCDNAGFAGWVKANEDELITLGDGHHYGEWVGPAIQKNPHNLLEKRFYLFNTQRWGSQGERCPSCCTSVRVLYVGENNKEVIKEAMEQLWIDSVFEEYTPEGIIIFNHLAKNRYKVTYDNAKGKWNETSSNI